MSQESLLPGTDAIPWNTAEICRYHGKLLVRTKSKARRTVVQRKFDLTDTELAHVYFWAQGRILEREVKESLRSEVRAETE